MTAASTEAVTRSDRAPTPDEQSLIDEMKAVGWPTDGSAFHFGTDEFGKPFAMVPMTPGEIHIRRTHDGESFQVVGYGLHQEKLPPRAMPRGVSVTEFLRLTGASPV